jgi:hypothetical protein
MGKIEAFNAPSVSDTLSMTILGDGVRLRRPATRRS